MDGDHQSIDLGQAYGHFIANLPPEDRWASQQELYRFVRWFGEDRSLSGLTAAEVGNYAERLSFSDTDYTRKLELVRAFLVYARKKGWSRTNLASHLRTRKGKSRPVSSPVQEQKEAVFLSRPGYIELENELEELKAKRLDSIEEVRRAAADKDFRENVPLEAARERRGKIEGQILELESILKSAVITDETVNETGAVSVGDTIVLLNLDSGEEVRYTLVNPREVNASTGKISSASPVGKAVIGKRQGEVVEANVPAGKLRYQIKQIG
ncbi:MAG: GreA/GreB family elongation factor [Dehalococcoidales bacterium]|nr:MAG: GreA/GreB family elongation factor [Dehalococcoidales bacterium]